MSIEEKQSQSQSQNLQETDYKDLIMIVIGYIFLVSLFCGIGLLYNCDKKEIFEAFKNSLICASSLIILEYVLSLFKNYKYKNIIINITISILFLIDFKINEWVNFTAWKEFIGQVMVVTFNISLSIIINIYFLKSINFFDNLGTYRAELIKKQVKKQLLWA